MANFINGSRLRVYREPLTTDMLERMHAANSRKQAYEDMKLQAQKEAKERAARNKQRRLYINHIQSTNDHSTKTPLPMLTVGLESPTNMHKALLDSGADTNVMPLSIFHTLKNKQQAATTEQLYTIHNTPITTEGRVQVAVYINGVKTMAHFELIQGLHARHLILGRPWITTQQGSLNFASGTITLRIGANHLRLPMEGSAVQANQVHPRQKKSHETSTYRWIPKKKASKQKNTMDIQQKRLPTRQSTPARKPHIQPHMELRRNQTTPTQRWIKKELLAKQGYYQGNAKIWVPKAAQQQSTQPYQHPGSPQKASKQPQKASKQPQRIWLPKAIQPIPQTVTTRVAAVKQTSQQWVPKNIQQTAPTAVLQVAELNTSSTLGSLHTAQPVLQTPTQTSATHRNNSPSTMHVRAEILQYQLFGVLKFR